MNLDEALTTFVIEAKELLLAMEESLLDMERGAADADAINAIFRAAPAFTAMALRTKHFGEGFGYYAECEKAAGDVCSLVRQGTLTSAAGAAELQKRVEAQYAQFVKDVAAAG